MNIDDQPSIPGDAGGMVLRRVDFGSRVAPKPTIQRVDSGRQRVLENILALRIAESAKEVLATGATIRPDHIVAAIQYACFDHGIVLTEEPVPFS